MSEQQKVYEFAKEIGMESMVLMDKIRAWKLPVKSHMATLSDDIINEIKTRLEEEAPKKKTKKKAAKKTAAKKTAAKKTTAKKTAVKKATTAKKKVVKKAVTKKVTVKKKAASSALEDVTAVKEVAAKKVAKKVAKKKAVIRRKAAYAPGGAPAEEEAPAARKAPETTVEADSDMAAVAASSSEAEAPVRKNIVGRMDLSKVRGPAQSQQQGSGGGDVRSPRSGAATRNIRTGFIAAPMPIPMPIEEEVKRKDEKPKKRGAGTKEVPVKDFKATDFRKREVIFQPKKKRLNVGRDLKKTQITVPKASKRVVKMYETIKVSDLAQQLGIKSPELIKKLMANGVMGNMNMDLDFDTASLIATEYKFEVETLHRSVEELYKEAAFGNLDAEPIPRPPVVTVMGHVDHGKTTLLDAIRKADVVSGEAGGITQHIGAYKVHLDGGSEVTFIDTPGHEAFTAMRARGANVTDIVILVVAADDGVMPQTIEAINHAKAADVPIIVALNKVDRPNSNPDKIKQQLSEHELVSEDWGGQTIFCEVSALQKTGIKELLEQVHLVAEILELKANPDRSAMGIVIESRMEKGHGAVATFLVQQGTMKVGQALVAGSISGRIRTMKNDQGKTIKQAIPGDPVEVVGLPEPPVAGDSFYVCKSEEIARDIAEQVRQQTAVLENVPNSQMSLEELFSKVKSGEVRELPIVLKADVAGSHEAIKGMFEKANTDEVKIKVIHTAVGGISESDILLASISGGMVIGFNVRPDTSAQKLAKEKGVEIKTYSVIYHLMDDIKKAMSGLLKPEFVEKSMGRAEVRETFTVPKMGMIAGCSVIDGKINRNNSLRLIREGRVVFEGKVGSLRRFKDDVKEVSQGYECGIGIENYNDLKVGDIIEAYTMEEVAREL